MIVFVLIIAIRFHFFYLFKYPGFFYIFEGFYGWIIIFLLSLFLYFVALFSARSRKDKVFVLLEVFPWVVFAAYFFVAACSILKYRDQPIYQSIGKEFNILNVFLALPLYKLTKDSKNKFIVLDICNVCMVFYCSLLLFQSVVFNASSKLILGFSDFFTTEYIFTRSFGIRIHANNLIPFTVLYSFWRLTKKEVHSRQALLFLIPFLIQFVALVGVVQTRIITIGVLAGLIIVLLFGPITKGKVVTCLIAVPIILFVIFSTNYVSVLLDSIFDKNNSESYSYYVRLDSITYYLECFSRNIFFGNGFATEKYYYSIEHGPNGTAYYSDVGFVGLMGETGIQSVAIFLVPFLYVLYAAWRSLSMRRSGYNFILALFATLLILSTCLPMYNHLEWPVLLALFAYEYSEIKVREISRYKDATALRALTAY